MTMIIHVSAPPPPLKNIEQHSTNPSNMTSSSHSKRPVTTHASSRMGWFYARG